MGSQRVGHDFTFTFRVLQRIRTTGMFLCTHAHTHRFILKNQELGHRIVRIGKSEICRIGQQAGNQGKN